MFTLSEYGHPLRLKHGHPHVLSVVGNATRLTAFETMCNSLKYFLRYVQEIFTKKACHKYRNKIEDNILLSETILH